ncbi:transglutaminase 5, like isoform 1-T1 [Synchiropus picturatus]
MEDLLIQNVNLEKPENHLQHRTDSFDGAKSLVVRRGAPFKVTVQLKGRPFNPNTDHIRIKVMLGRLYVVMPVTFHKEASATRWRAYMDPEGLNLKRPSIYISPPAVASVGSYRFQLCVFTPSGKRSCKFGKFVLLCNPWCSDDTVYIPFEDQREEYILNDSCLLFMGSCKNVVSRPWSYDQFEPGVLEACLNLLQVSPEHQKNRRRDYLLRNNPVYIGRVVSAMINSEDDRGVLKGKWSGTFKDGVNPALWTGSGDILTKWAQSGYQAVKYGQCWVFAAVMCTVMRVLGIPCRVVTNFNSAHDTNGNLVIEEYYSETGQKLRRSKDSIWNFHVWVECWMTRGDLGSDMDGWQVLDPTPQERSGGVFCCGPAPVRAIKERRIDLLYDVPFVYAEVNADVHTMIVSQGRVVSHSMDTERVGSLICTKVVGFPRVQNITGDYKFVKGWTSPMSSRSSTLSSRSSGFSEDSTLTRAGSSSGATVSLDLDKAPIAGEPINFTIKVVNLQKVSKMMKLHLNAQAKEYNSSPSDTFWEVHGVLHLGPMEVKTIKKQIFPAEYEDVVGDDLINLAVVVEDTSSEDRLLASEEFNIASPELIIQIADEKSIRVNQEQVATVTFKNPFSHPVSGALTLVGSGLIHGKVHFRLSALRAGGTVEQSFSFTPFMLGTKMLQASLSLFNTNSTIRGFKMIYVNRS